MKYPLLGLCFLIVAGGCSSAAPPLSSDQEKQATDLDRIARESGGDWNKVSAADRKIAIQICGNEGGARMILYAKAGHAIGGPHRGGGTR